ncbi:MAG: hypothetical protein ACHQ6T_05315 [Myxococcota bacterium]
MGIARVCHTSPLLALSLFVSACAASSAPQLYRSAVVGFGQERYSAWFADERAGVIYFGLSPFWTAMRAHGGDPRADLLEPSAHLIGRFDTERGQFLPPLVARRPGPDSASSVWDVLAHPNGWIYYTTYFEEMGRVRPGMGDVEHFDALGTGLNEIALGPDGNLYVTRYGAGRGRAAQDGALVVVSPEGRLLRETRLHARDGAVTAPKSVAVDPLGGDVWLNADVIAPDGAVTFAAFHLASDLRELARVDPPPELLFVAFDRLGRGFFVEDRSGRLELRVTRAGAELLRLDLGPRVAADFAQDIHFAADGTAAIAFWSGRVELVRQTAAGFERARVDFVRPAECAGPETGAIFYSAFVESLSVYATLYCDAAIARAPLPPRFLAAP